MSSSKNNYRQAFDKLIHDIKNPLGRIRTRLEMAVEGEESIKEYKEAIIYCYETSDKILKLMDTLADIFRSELREVKEEEIFLSAMLREVLAIYDLAIEEKKIHLTTQLSSDDRMIGDPKLIKKLIASLIDNSVKYCDENDQIKIEINSAYDVIEFKISDTGVGIPQEEIPFLWERMFRGSQGKSINPEGMGLGLTLVKAVCEAHRGEITVRSPILKDRGSEISIRLPKNKK